MLPKILLDDSTTAPHGIGTHLAADVVERNTQKILVVRDTLSQFIKTAIIPNQTTDTLRQALLSLVLDMLPDMGATIRVDGATAFQALERESKTNGSLLNKLNIKIEVGRLLNKNKNPDAENAVKELEKEILRYVQAKGAISQTDLDIVTRNINSRIRANGLSAKEIMYRRDMITNEDIVLKEESIKTSL